MKKAEQKLQEIYKNRLNNAKGHFFEKEIENACKRYKEDKVASIDKTPEPFRVLEKNHKTGIFRGRFIAHAQPDFKGSLKGGKSIVFEAKYTSTDRIKAAVITKEQEKALEEHYELGAVVGVCVGIIDRYFFVPWRIWRDMKEHIGRKSASVEDLKKYEVPYRYGRGLEFLKKIEEGQYEE